MEIKTTAHGCRAGCSSAADGVLAALGFERCAGRGLTRVGGGMLQALRPLFQQPGRKTLRATKQRSNPEFPASVESGLTALSGVALATGRSTPTESVESAFGNDEPALYA